MGLAEGSPIRFWYRQTPVPRIASDFWNGWGEESFARVNQANPPWVVPGELGVELDPNGRLIRFRALPRLEPDRPRTAETAPWQEWFPAELTGFDLQVLEPVQDRGPAPPDAYDQLQVWKGAGPGTNGLFYVEATAYAGRPAYFEVFNPAQFQGESPAEAMWLPPLPSQVSVARQRGVSLVQFLWLSVLVGAAVLAWRNVRLGRTDRKGAFRVAFVFFCSGLLIWLLLAHHTLGGYESGVLDIGLAQALRQAAVSWLLYSALEPYIRRFWPQALISWSRLVHGQWRDPLVGQNVLLGILAGVASAIPFRLQVLAPSWLGLASQAFLPSHPLTLAGPTALAGAIFSLIFVGTFRTLFVLMLLLFFRLVLRRTLLVGCAYVAVLTVMLVLFLEAHPVLGWFACGSWALLLFWVLTRLGLLAGIVMQLSGVLLGAFPLTTDLSAWYAGHGFIAVAFLLAHAAFGFYTSQAGWPIFNEPVAAPSPG